MSQFCSRPYFSHDVTETEEGGRGREREREEKGSE